MPALTYQDIFGNNSLEIDSGGGIHRLQIQLNDLLKQNLNGDLNNTVGASDVSSLTPVQAFYGLLLLVMENQAEKINDDPEQKIFIADAGKALATSTRDGQIKKSFTVNFFLDVGVVGVPTLEDIDLQDNI